MNVSAVLVTRGNVDMKPVIDSIPEEWEKVIWNNGTGNVVRWSGPTGVDSPTKHWEISDLSVYGRYAAIEYATHELIYVADDDVIVSDPQEIVDTHPLVLKQRLPEDHPGHPHDALDGAVVCNMPQEFRHAGYTDSALVGFGAAFHRDAPERAFQKWWQRSIDLSIGGICMPKWGFDSPTFINSLGASRATPWRDPYFQRTCDVVFTTLTERVLVDVQKVNREFAEDADRMYRQPEHFGERARMLELARQVRDA